MELQIEIDKLKEELKVTHARLQAHVDTLNECLNTNMTFRINLNLTEKSRQEFIALHSKANERIAELEKQLEEAKAASQDA